jgi:hypothetical protein
MQARFELMVVASPGHDAALDLWNEASGDIYATRDLYVRVTATRVMLSQSAERRVEAYALSGVYDPYEAAFGDTVQAWRKRIIAMARYLDEMHRCVVQPLTFYNVELVDVRDGEGDSETV